MSKFRYFVKNYILHRKIRLLLAYSFLFIGLFFNIESAIRSLENFDLLGVISFSFSFPVLPTFILLFFVLVSSDMYLKELHIFKVMRLFNRKQLEDIIIGNILFSSVVFLTIAFIFNFGISVSMFGLSLSFFSFNTFVWFVVNFVFLMLCFFIVGMIITIVGLVFRNLFIGIIFSIILPLIDMYSPISFVFRQAILNVNHVAEPLNLIYTLLYLLFIIYVLINILRKVISKYDFY
ncbi:hypothetical protein [Bacillus mycoides]|uniref:hypothetical protein n=1 Tax=Bacillus mycoides TaxID=1405 RepID=UPI0008641DC8|nr:hypothetical protein [Bacillus mycoides]OHX31077.1 hypothetical protein BWGOE5_29820 [Bacillus mycoides]SCM90504.1 Uncharacterized protein BWAI21_06025 [Bacillus mycoides]